MDCGLPGCCVCRILQARIWEWVAVPSSRGPSRSKDWTWVSCGSCIAGTVFIAEPPGNPIPGGHLEAYGGTEQSQKRSWNNSGEMEKRFLILSVQLLVFRVWVGELTPLPHPAHTIPCGQRETGPRLSFSQLITMVCLPETCGIVLYLQELRATVTVCGFPSLWSNTRWYQPPNYLSPRPQMEKKPRLPFKQVFVFVAEFSKLWGRPYG